MINNATITSHTVRGDTGPDGTETWGEPAEFSARCNFDTPTVRQRQSIGATIAEATAVLRVPKSKLAGVVLAQGDRLAAKVDGDAAAQAYRIVHVVNRQKAGGLAHWEVFLQE